MEYLVAAVHRLAMGLLLQEERRPLVMFGGIMACLPKVSYALTLLRLLAPNRHGFLLYNACQNTIFSVHHVLELDLERQLKEISLPAFLCRVEVLNLYYWAGVLLQINNLDYTEMALEGIVGAVEAARTGKQQVVETEHLMKALLEQKDGLARRIFTKAGLDNTSVLQETDNFISQQPKVVGDTSGPILGSHLSSLLENTKKHKKEMGDSFVSVEHMLLAFLSDKRFGQKLFRDLQLTEKALKDAVNAVRGSQRVTDPNPEGKYEALDKYGNDLTELARRGKLDPVIGRDDEIRRCIQILSRRTKNNPVIIGEPGVGKTAIAEGYDL
ncbi:Chaperone protein ClpB3, mitochondrial [Capsicum chinense]|nr:Chaperone protein ClpB3, mitochondrial [Capsicum chinense]